MNNIISLLKNIWKVYDFDERESLYVSQKYDIDFILAKLINIRGIKPNEIENYLNPIIETNLLNPFILKDMKKAVLRTTEAITNNETIGIIADYDVDGSTSAAIMSKFFIAIKKIPVLEIPNRLIDGYGPNLKIINKLIKQNIHILFTLDCGTTSNNILDNNDFKHIDTIIIDHHMSENTLPKVHSIINPNRYDEKNNYNNLAAVGVTFLFLMALRKQLREMNYFSKNNIKEPNLLLYLDLVAMGTVCDVVNLVNYNRAIVSKGLEIIHKRTNKGIAKIIDNSKINYTPTITDLSFTIGPQLNAASRIDDSSLPSKLLLSENIVEIEYIAKKLFLLNEKRKLIETRIYEEAISQIKFDKNKKIIVVKGEKWHPGVLGIIASRIVEKYNKPAAVISYHNNIGIGSARSIKNINLGNAIMSAKRNNIILSGGGHKMAAGFKISIDLITKFEDYLINYFDQYDTIFFDKISYFDSYLSLDEINIELLENLEKLEPFGNGNKEPIFFIKNVYIDHYKILKDKHILLFCKNNFKVNLKAICFNCIENDFGQNIINNNLRKYNLICSIKRDNFSNNIAPQIIVYDGFIAN